MNQRRSFLAHTDPKKINFLTVKSSIERKINDINSYQNNRGAVLRRSQRNRKPSQMLNNRVMLNNSTVAKVKPKGLLGLLAQEKNNTRFNRKQKQNTNYNETKQEKENLDKSIEQKIEEVKNKILQLQEIKKTNNDNKKVDSAIKEYEKAVGFNTTDSLPDLVNDKEKYFFGSGKTTSFYYTPQKQSELSNKGVTEESIEDSGTKINIVVNNNRYIK